MRGGCWFFTVTLRDRRSTALTDRIGTLRSAVTKTLARHPFRIDAIVVLPDHIHTVWTLPPEDTDFSTRWRLIKTHFTKAVPESASSRPVRPARGERDLWQQRFREHLIRDEDDLRRHIEYCYINPQKHGLVRRVRDWPFSSFHRDAAAGLFPEDWAGTAETTGAFGERS